MTIAGVAVLAALFAVAGARTTASGQVQVEEAPPTERRFHGEYGLWVQESADSLQVHWITREPGAGYLSVVVEGRPAFEIETESDTAHSAAFRKPAARAVTLRYGGVRDPQDANETVIYFDLPERPIQLEFSGIDTVYVVGDVHGEYEQLTELLGNAGLIDEEGRWAGGRSFLVLLGDLFDRGPDVLKTLWFLYGLERDAARHGGRVQIVLGNHEIMVMTNDLGYTSTKEKRIAELHEIDYWRMFDPRASVLGQWLASKPALIRIDGVLLAHGGVGPAYLSYSIREFDDSLARFMDEDWFRRLADSTAAYVPMDSIALFRRLDFFFAGNSVLWYRGYVAIDTLRAALDDVLRKFDSELHVIGHTPVDSIHQAYDGDVIAVDLKDPAREMLMLVRASEGYKRFRYKLSGPPEPLALPESAPGHR